MSLAGLKAGKHVVCEKPLAMNTGETAEIVKLAKSSRPCSRSITMCAFIRRSSPCGRWWPTAHLARLFTSTAHTCRTGSLRTRTTTGACFPRKAASFGVADIGTHWMDTASFILGAKINSVFAELGTWHKTRKRPLGEVQTFAKSDAKMKYATYPVKTEDYASVLLHFNNGTRGNLGVSQVAAGRKNCIRIEIYGSVKSAWWSSEEPEMLHFGNRDSANETALRATPAFGDGAAGLMDYPPGHVEGFPDTFKMGFRSIYNSVLAGGKGKSLFADAQAGHEEVAVCEAIMKSNQSEAWVKL